MAALPSWAACRPQQKFQTWSGNGSVESGRPSPASGIDPGHLQRKYRVLVHLRLEDVHRLLDQAGSVPGDVIRLFRVFCHIIDLPIARVPGAQFAADDFEVPYANTNLPAVFRVNPNHGVSVWRNL